MKSGTQDDFFTELLKLVVRVDVDSAHWVEWVWAFRASHHLPTRAFVEKLPGTENVRIDGLINVFKELHLSCPLATTNVFRAFAMNGTMFQVPDLVIGITQYSLNNPYAIVLVGDPDIVQKYESYFRETYQAPEIRKVNALTGVGRDGSFRTSLRVIQSEGIDVGHDVFYPFIPEGISTFVQQYHESKENALLLIGPYGTGKSTLIRTMMLTLPYENYGLCNNQQALEHPDVVDWMSSFDDRSMVALEDCDQLIAKREDGNAQMSGLLNITDGVISNHRKIVLSTNLPSVSKVDPALLRRGRMHNVVQFRNLTHKEANAARAAINLPPLPNELSDVSLSLSDALNFEKTRHASTLSAAFGFSSKGG